MRTRADIAAEMIDALAELKRKAHLLSNICDQAMVEVQNILSTGRVPPAQPKKIIRNLNEQP